MSPRVLGTIAVVLAVIIGGRILLPVPLPVISLPAETIGHIGPLRITNTLLHTLVADIIILALAYFGTRNMKLVPSGLQNVLEWIIEALYNLSESVAGEAAKRYFPIIATIFILVLVANWLELVPGVDSIGWIETHEGYDHYPVREAGPLLLLGLDGVEPFRPAEEGATGGEVHHDVHTLPLDEEGVPNGMVVPWLRASATDLNFTFALALIVMFLVQYYGWEALGKNYFTKFFNFREGGMNAFIGIIELISEVGKTLTFAFRLFGNIFGGQVLLFVAAFLAPFLLPVAFYGIEFFVGLIQAFVFAILALVFFSIATTPHSADH